MIATLAIAAALAGAACRSQPESVAAAASPPLAGGTPVGPIPGPVEDPPLATNPFRDDPVARMEGRRLFMRMNCAGCHGDHGGGGMGPSLRDAAWLYGSADARIADSIAAGRAHGMPAWGRMLTAAQVWKLVAYISSMRTEREPEPPPGS